MPENFWDNRLRFQIDTTTKQYEENILNQEQWEQLETLGVVFFPSGWVGTASLDKNDNRVYSLCFDYFCSGFKSDHNAVRLIKDIK